MAVRTEELRRQYQEWLEQHDHNAGPNVLLGQLASEDMADAGYFKLGK